MTQNGIPNPSSEKKIKSATAGSENGAGQFFVLAQKKLKIIQRPVLRF